MAENNLKSVLDDVHKMLMDNFDYESDLQQYGVIEKWVMPNEAYTGRQKIRGDCDDFALACRRLLRDRGINSRLVVCLTETGEGHLVVEVHGYILDNRHHKVMRNDDLKYGWLYISGYQPGDPWHQIVPKSKE